MKKYDILEVYNFTKSNVLLAGYDVEIEWQKDVLKKCLIESDFYREMAWVVLNSGFRESIIRKKFSKFSYAFFDWQDSDLILLNEEFCKQSALQIFGSRAKVNAILKNIKQIKQEGFETFKARMYLDPIHVLSELAFIGNITSYHLAKNVGIDISKPDRHLVRVAQLFGYKNVDEFCAVISSLTGDPVAVVDIVLWRFAEKNTDYLKLLSTFLNPQPSKLFSKAIEAQTDNDQFAY